MALDQRTTSLSDLLRDELIASGQLPPDATLTNGVFVCDAIRNNNGHLIAEPVVVYPFGGTSRYWTIGALLQVLQVLRAR